MTRLFIFDKEVELDKEVQFTLTKQFEDLSSPTAIINDWSKTVEIPATSKNNELFGNIFHPDRLIPSGSITPIGLYFDPTKKLDFTLLWNDNIVMTGYAKFNSVSRVNNKTTYNITLNGQLGKIFQDLKKMTFDPNSVEPEESQYIIDGSQYVSNYITKDLVKESWTHNQSYLDLQDALDHNSWTSIIGFACNANNYNDEFDSKTVLTSATTDGRDKHTESFADILAAAPAFQATNLSAEQVVGDGLLPRQFGEFRSYCQQPFIYFNKFWQIFFREAKTLTGYDVDMDTTWFNNSNPYWTNTAMMLKNLEVKDGENIYNQYRFYPAGFGIFEEGGTNWDVSHNCVLNKGLSRSDVTEEVNLGGWNSNPTFIIEKGGAYMIEGSNPYQLMILNADADKLNHYCVFSDVNGLEIRYYAADEDGNVLGEYKTLVLGLNSTISTEEYDNVIRLDRVPIRTLGDTYFNFDVTFRFPVNAKSNQDFKLYAETKWLYTDDSHIAFYIPTLSYYYLRCQLTVNVTGTNVSKIGVNRYIKRSYSHFTLNDLWNNDYNVFNTIINYCKMFRLYISVDDVNKKILVQRSSTYFSNYTVSNWDDKLDMSKDFVITPISWDSKYIRFNYKESDIERVKQYAEKFGVQYGELKLATDYNFNTKETDIIENSIHDSINATENILFWQNMYRGNIVYNYMNEVYPCVADKDGKRVDNFGALYFHNGLQNFELLDVQNVRLSDDTPFEQLNNNYCYNDLWKTRDYSDYVVEVSTYPKLSVIRDNKLIVWNTPKEVYDRQDYSNKNGVFKNMWEKYINERYSIQNKKVTCYLYLTPADFISFDYNHFITLGNQLYMVNKIYDCNINSVDSTKVDLISIRDIEGYTTDNFAV